MKKLSPVRKTSGTGTPPSALVVAPPITRLDANCWTEKALLSILLGLLDNQISSSEMYLSLRQASTISKELQVPEAEMERVSALVDSMWKQRRQRNPMWVMFGT